MILLPAIDILEGKAVRLVRGDFERKTVYDREPINAALRWIQAGARALHIVDLDGARSGEPQNLDHVRRITEAVTVPVQLGGGLRTIEAVGAALEAGATRVVLGTAAFRDLDFLDEALALYPNKVVVSIDAREGRLAASGWTEQTEIPVEKVIEALGARGVTRYVYSSIERDGMLTGPDLDEVKRIGEVIRGSYVYSGGISSIDDLKALRALRQVNLSGVIVGKALYEEHFDVGSAQSVLVR